MTTNAERAAVLTGALYAGLARDSDAIRTTYTDDVRSWTPASASSSRAELMAELERRDDAFSEHELEVVPLDVGGEHACVEWTVRMTHTGPLEVASGMIVEPTGVRVTLHGVTVAEFHADQICSLRQYWDEFAVFEQLGLLSGDDTE